MQKIYYIDTNILIDNPDAVELLSDNRQNKVKLHQSVIDEIDKLKKDPKLSHIVYQITKNLLKNTDLFDIVGKESNKYTDDVLLNFIDKTYKDKSHVRLITADKILQIKAKKRNIITEELKRSNPFIDVSNGDYTGFIDFEKDEFFNNCFYWKDGELWFYKNRNLTFKVDINKTVWDVQPRDYFQSAFFQLGLDDSIDIFTVQGPAGTGKTFLSLALAFYHVFERKNFEKIYIVKATYEIGQKLGYLPGDIDEKMYPYMEYIQSLIEKLTNGSRKISKLYKDVEKFEFNRKKFQILPINYIRGRDIENAVIIVDEVQNLSRDEVRTLLSRMGKNIKCICIGDKTQIDNPYLNKYNNGLNWILKYFKNFPNYSHITIQSELYRGPICELVVKSGL